ncbi:MAG: hypothetical protein JSV49_06280 [Thermoplasmata archaeon]|nr:MAG: hypothetical protein JSV49_06280 [Thermoplasmata archaeon]
MVELEIRRIMLSIYLIFALATVGFVGLMIFEIEVVEESAEAATYIVDPAGNQDFTTIQAAINAAGSGDTIYVWAGTYVENVVVNKSVSIIGNASINTTINGGGSGDTVYVNASWANLTGFYITGSGTSGNASGLKIHGVSNIKLTDVNCTSNRYGLFLNVTTEITIKNSSFRSNFIYQTIVVDSNNHTFYNCTFYADSVDCFESLNGTDIYIEKSSLYVIPAYTLLRLDRASHVYFIDSVYTPQDVRYYDTASRLTVEYSLTLRVLDSGQFNPVKGVKIDIMDNLSASVGTFYTDSAGYTPAIQLKFYTGRDLNFDTDDLDANERINYTKHNLTFTQQGFYTKYFEPYMDHPAYEEIFIDEIPLDYFVIQDQSGPAGINVSGMEFQMGKTYTLFASAYNIIEGYVMDIPVSWSCNNTEIAMVTPSGTQTTLTTSSINHGSVRISASYDTLSSYVDIYIMQQDIDFIKIQDTNLADGGWVANRNIHRGLTDIFYCGGYNNTGGFLGLVPATWTSENPAIGTVTSPGPFTVFTASNSSTGETKVTATYLTFTNVTGVINVIPPVIDYIEIRTDQNGTGSKLDTGTYTIGQNVTFYCAAYNHTYGFVDDVNASWKSLTPSVGTVTSPGYFTIFSPISEGSTKIEATFQGFHYNTADLNVTDLLYIDLTIKDNIEPAGPVLNARNLSLVATIENLGTKAAYDILVQLYDGHPLLPGGKLLKDTIIPTIPGPGTDIAKFEFPSTQFTPGLHGLYFTVDWSEAIDESDESNNIRNYTLDVKTITDWIVAMEINPRDVGITADDQQQYHVEAIGLDDKNYTIQAVWNVTGGGSIDQSGLFTASKVGTWKIYATFGKISVFTTVTIFPGALKNLEILKDRDVFKIGDSYQFNIKASDADGNNIHLQRDAVEWYVNGSIGTINKGGFFNATGEGLGYIGAKIEIAEGINISAEVPVWVKLIIITERQYELKDKNATFIIKFAFTVEGNATIENLRTDRLQNENITEASFGEFLQHLGIFIKIELPPEAEFEWVIIECEYNPDLIPEDLTEDDFVLYYFDIHQDKWIKCEDTWVDPSVNKVFANVSHLTIFAPMADTSGADDQPDTEEGAEEDKGLGMGYIMILSLAAIVFVIILAVGLIIIRKRKVPSDLEGEEEREEGEHEMVERELVEGEEEGFEEVDLTELEVITQKCPSCKTQIDVEPAYDEKIKLECPECGKKGRLPNPYLEEIEQLREEKRRAGKPKPEKKKRAEPIEIDCRKCGETIKVPYSEDSKIEVHCEECGARGRIKNPYLGEEEEPEIEPERLKKSKGKKPPKHEEEDEEEEIDWGGFKEEEEEADSEYAEDDDFEEVEFFEE